MAQPQPKIRIKLKAHDHRVLDLSAKEILETAQRTGARISGPIPLPSKRELFTVLRSPFIDKKAREQFQLITHKRLIDILEPTSKTIDALRKLNLPSGVYVEVK
jgi:small subunit ribosomal protein S10